MLIHNFRGIFSNFSAVLHDLTTTPPEGLVPGNDTASVISRAHYHVHRGALANAIAEIDTLEPASKEVFLEWSDDVKNKLVVDKTLFVFHKHVDGLVAEIAKRKEYKTPKKT